LVSSAQICIASSPEVPFTASPPVSGKLKPIVIGGPDGASAGAAADAASMIVAAVAIPSMNLRNMLPPLLGRSDSLSL